jgi:hypothetical protein
VLLNPRAKLAVVVYGISVAALATAPIWIRILLLRSYEEGDNFGSGADVYVWFMYTAISFLILCAATILSVNNMMLPRAINKIMLLSFPICVWILSILYLIYMR